MAVVVTYCLITLTTGKAKEVPVLMWVLAAAFVVYVAYDPIEQLLGVA